MQVATVSQRSARGGLEAVAVLVLKALVLTFFVAVPLFVLLIAALLQYVQTFVGLLAELRFQLPKQLRPWIFLSSLPFFMAVTVAGLTAGSRFFSPFFTATTFRGLRESFRIAKFFARYIPPHERL